MAPALSLNPSPPWAVLTTLCLPSPCLAYPSLPTHPSFPLAGCANGAHGVCQRDRCGRGDGDGEIPSARLQSLTEGAGGFGLCPPKACIAALCHRPDTSTSATPPLAHYISPPPPPPRQPTSSRSEMGCSWGAAQRVM